MKQESALFEQLSVLTTQQQIQCNYVKQNQKLMTRIVVRVSRLKARWELSWTAAASDSVGVWVSVQGTCIFKVGKRLLSTSAINFPNYCQTVGKPLISCAKNNLSTTAAASGMSRNNTCSWRMCSGYFKFFLTPIVANMKTSEINETPRLGLYVAWFFTSTAWWLYPSC